nr:MAG TPA: zinc finger domain protein [Caudoviricetes sp.]
MTQTLTTETIKQWRSDAENIASRSCEYETEYSAAEAILALTAELLANREAQPVGFYTTVSGRKGVVWHNGAPEDDTAIYTAPPAPAVPDDYQHLKNVQELYHSQEERLFALAQRIKGVSFDKYSHTTAQAIDALEREIFGDDGGACRAAMLAQPVSSGYKLASGCQWSYDEMDFKWDSSCGESWQFIDGGPSENGVKFCQGCGKPVLLAAAPEGGNDHDTGR